MQQNLKALITLIILATTVQALTIDYGVYNINNRVGIPSATIKIYGNETQLLNQTNTNDDGYATLDINETLTYYNIIISKIGYYDINKNTTYTVDAVDSSYMIPISTDGIIRLRFNDLTLQDHKFCVYFAENNRLDQCYERLNETVTILTNREYIIVPTITKYDIVSTPTNIINYSYIFGGTLIGIAIIVLIVGIFGFIIRKLIKGR